MFVNFFFIRKLPKDKFIGHDSKGPYIALKGETVTLERLGRHIVWRAGVIGELIDTVDNLN